MSHRRALLFPVLLLAVDACSATSTPGQLGNGAFVYVCNDPMNDAACDGTTQATTALPNAVAVGANFTVGYDPGSGAAGLVPGSPESATPSILANEGGALRFLSAGNATLVVEGNGGIVDFAEIAGGDIATFAIDVKASGFDCEGPPPSPPDAGAGGGGAGGAGTGGGGSGGGSSVDAGSEDAGSEDAGSADAGAEDAGSADAGAEDAGAGTGGAGSGGGATGGAGGSPSAVGSGNGGGTGSGGHMINAAVTLSQDGTSDITCDPIDNGGNVLAGEIMVTAESSDPTIVSVATSSFSAAHAIQLCGWAPGAVTITVRGGGKTATFRATVTGEP